MHQSRENRAAPSLSSCTERKVTSCPYGRRNHANLVGHWHLGSAATWPRPGPPTTIHHASGISGSSHSFIEVSRVKVLVGYQSCSSRFHNRIPKGKEGRRGKAFSNGQRPRCSRQNGSAILAANVWPHITCKCKHSKLGKNNIYIYIYIIYIYIIYIYILYIYIIYIYIYI